MKAGLAQDAGLFGLSGESSECSAREVGLKRMSTKASEQGQGGNMIR